MRWIAAVVMMLGMFVPASTFARDIHVNNQVGDDRSTGRFPQADDQATGPVRTLRHALKIATKFDRILLANTDKPYRESVTLWGGDNSGGPRLPFVIDGNGATLDGSRPIELVRWEPVNRDTFRYLPEKMTYPQLYLNSVPAPKVEPEQQYRLPKLEPLQWTQVDRYVYFRVEKGKTLGEYDLREPGADVGITLWQVRHLAIGNLVVQGFRLDGISAADTVSDCTLENIVARGNGRSGIAVKGASRVEIRNCILGSNGTTQLWVEGYPIAKLFGGKLLGTDVPVITRHRFHGTLQTQDVEGAE